MTNIIKPFFVVFFSCLLQFSVLYAQSNSYATDSLPAKIISYGKKNAPSSLFICFDKTVYVNNESVWFTAYLLNYNKKPSEPDILSAILVNDQTGKMELEQKFEMTNGLSFGHAVIPDSIPPGDYSFITYTNILINGMPRDVFIQPITIKSAAESSFDVSLKLVDSAKTGNNARIALSVETKDHLPVKGVAAVWALGMGKDNIASGMVKTDTEGKYLLSIPRSKIRPGKNFLNVRATYKNDVRDVKMVLPVDDKTLDIGFYPEGGNLVDGLVSAVGWETKTAYGRPISVEALLYENNHVIDTIHTDSYGMGRFRFMPHLGGKYELKLTGLPGSDYTLPRILPDGVVVTAQKVIADDSLQLKLTSKSPGKFLVMVHNFKQVFYSCPVEVTAAGKRMLINLTNLPKGLSTITVLNSLQQPCAERIFFAHYNRRNKVNVTTDRPTYGARQKVRIKLRLPAAVGDPSKGIVTVACVQSNKIEEKKANDIESYFYLKRELQTLPLRDIYMGQSAADKDYLEKVLLIKGWRKYKWQDLILVDAKKDKMDEKRILLGGEVTRYGKSLKKPVNLVEVTDSATRIITTDAKGDFQLNANSAATAERKRLYLILSDGTDNTYQIKMNDSFNMINRALLTGLKATNYYLTPAPAISSDSTAINGLNHVLNLKEIKITGRKGDDYNLRLIRLAQKNECGDYVCNFNVLNCPNHPDEMTNKAPVVGKSYTDASGETIVYKGCTIIPKGPSVLAVDGVNYPREFYGPDYSVFNPPEPEYQSTIFWKHACFISTKETVLEFYTSDVTGRFSIIVQGILSNDVIFAKKDFVVNKK